MELLEGLAPALRRFLPLLATLAALGIGLAAAHWLLIVRQREHPVEKRAGRQAILLAATVVAVVLAVLALPVSETMRVQLLGLLGLVLTAVIALSSTTFVANAMASLMLRAVRSFRPGDFVRVEEHFGRVTELGLFHTEIQTEDRDLTTLPNLYLIAHPVTVVRASGTIVSTHLSLGYDVSHATLEPLLVEAAGHADLAEPFVQILELGNFAVSYRVAGFLSDPKHLLSARSRLRASVLDTLHGAGIEIVSPDFMNQRRLPREQPILPAVAPPPGATPVGQPAPEAVIFDKAERAQELDALRGERETLRAELAELERSPTPGDATGQAEREREIGQRRQRLEKIEATLRSVEDPTSS